MCGCDDFDQVAKFVARLGVGGDGLGDLGFHALAKALSQPVDGYFHRALADSELDGGVGLIGVAGELGFEDVEMCIFVGCGMFFGQCLKREGEYG